MIEFDLRGADDRSATEIRETMRSLMQDWSDVSITRVATADMPTALLGQTTKHPDGSSSVIEINREIASDYDYWRECVAKAVTAGGFHRDMRLVQRPAEFTIAHEFGHALSLTALGSPMMPEYDENIRNIVMDAWTAVGWLGPRLANMVPTMWEHGIGAAEVGRDLSLYATSAPDELVAESFAVNRMIGAGKSRIADEVTRGLTMRYQLKATLAA